MWIFQKILLAHGFGAAGIGMLLGVLQYKFNLKSSEILTEANQYN